MASLGIQQFFGFNFLTLLNTKESIKSLPHYRFENPTKLIANEKARFKAGFTLLLNS